MRPLVCSLIMAVPLCLLFGCATPPVRDDIDLIVLAANTRVAADRAPTSEEPPLLGVDGPVSLAQLLAQAQRRSPMLQAALRRSQAARERIDAAARWPDAMLDVVEIGRDGLEGNLRLSQTIPWPGKISSRVKRAHADALRAEANAELARRQTNKEIAFAFVEVQALDARLSIARETVALLSTIEESVLARLRVGQLPQASLLRVQVERQSMESDVASLEARRTALLTALYRVSGVFLAPNAGLEALPQNALHPAPSRETLMLGVAGHPSLQAVAAEAAAAKAMQDEASAESYPDLNAGLAWSKTDANGMATSDDTRELSVMLGLMLPWQWGATHAARRAAESEAQAAQFDIAQQSIELFAELEGYLFAYNDARRMTALYTETVLTSARQAVALVQADFVAERATLLELLDAERALLAAQLSFVDAYRDGVMAQAELEYLTGGTINDPNK